MTNRPKIVCLCGSTRFFDAFQQANYDETMAGNIVLSVGFYRPSPQVAAELARGQHEGTHGETWGCTPEQKVMLDRLHLHKIDLADRVLVLNVGGYVGESTTNEVAYAIMNGKPIRFLEHEAGEAWLENHTHDLGQRIAKLVTELTGENQ